MVYTYGKRSFRSKESYEKWRKFYFAKYGHKTAVRSKRVRNAQSKKITVKRNNKNIDYNYATATYDVADDKVSVSSAEKTGYMPKTITTEFDVKEPLGGDQKIVENKFDTKGNLVASIETTVSEKSEREQYEQLAKQNPKELNAAQRKALLIKLKEDLAPYGIDVKTGNMTTQKELNELIKALKEKERVTTSATKKSFQTELVEHYKHINTSEKKGGMVPLYRLRQEFPEVTDTEWQKQLKSLERERTIELQIASDQRTVMEKKGGQWVPKQGKEGVWYDDKRGAIAYMLV